MNAYQLSVKMCEYMNEVDITYISLKGFWLKDSYLISGEKSSNICRIEKKKEICVVSPKIFSSFKNLSAE